jgi:hypothetical protein
MTTVPEMLQDLEKDRFFGTVELVVQGGHVVIVRKTETFKVFEDKIFSVRDQRERQEGNDLKRR